MSEEKEPIPVAASTRRELEAVREPDESFDDVVRRLLEVHDRGADGALASALGEFSPGDSAEETLESDDDIVCPGCGRSFGSWGQLNVHQAGVDAAHFEEP